MQTVIYRDFDAFAADVRDVDCVMLLQNPSRRVWTIRHANLPGIHIQLGRLGSGNIVEGQSWRDGYVFYMPLSNTCEYSANGTALKKDSLMVLEPGCEFCISTKSDHDWCTIFVSADKLARSGGLLKPSGSEKMTCRVASTGRQVADRFRALVSQVMIADTNCSGFESSLAATRAEAELLKVASSIVDGQPAHAAVQAGRPRFSRQEVIRRAKQLLFEERDGKPVRVGELAVASGVSERTLRTAFNEYFGTGPVRYLHLRQLHLVKLALQAADPATESVAKVFVRHGEWEFGRFAARYHQLFGERPSETLQRTAR